MFRQTVITLTSAAAIGVGFAGSADAATVIYESSFEGTDGGWTATNDWERGSINFTAAGCDFTNETGPSSAFDGSEAWGTVLNSCYQNLAATSSLSQAFDLSGFTNASLNWQQFVEVLVPFDRAELYVNGDLLYQRETAAPTPDWEQQTVDLTPYVGGLANISFALFATDVVNQPGWYIDSVSITSTDTLSTSVPEPASLLGLAAIGAVAAGGALKKKAAA